MAIRKYQDSLIQILSSESVSNSFQVGPKDRIVGVVTPSAWDAADIGFEVSIDNTTFYRVVDPVRTTAATSHARIINVETAASRFYIVPECLDLQLGGWMKLTSINTASNVAVAQTSDRILEVYISQISGA